MIQVKNQKLIESTLPAMREHGKEIATVFYRQLLDAHPELRPMFASGDQESGVQAERLARAILAYMGNLTRLDVLGPVVTNISRRHVSLLVVPEQYPIVRDYLLNAIKVVLKEAATAEVIDAWREAYEELASVMIACEKVLYAEAAGTQTTSVRN